MSECTIGFAASRDRSRRERPGLRASAGTPEHRAARRAIERAAASATGFGTSMGTVAEFWSIVTHEAAIGGPSKPERAAAFLGQLGPGGIVVWNPGEGFAALLTSTPTALGIRGARIFDLQIAMVAVEHGASEMWTHDTRFVRIPGLRIVDPIDE